MDYFDDAMSMQEQQPHAAKLTPTKQQKQNKMLSQFGIFILVVWYVLYITWMYRLDHGFVLLTSYTRHDNLCLHFVKIMTLSVYHAYTNRCMCVSAIINVARVRVWVIVCVGAMVMLAIMIMYFKFLVNGKMNVLFSRSIAAFIGK